MKTVMFLFGSVFFCFSSVTVSASVPQSCPTLNGHFGNEIADFSIHTGVEGGAFSYALGPAPFTFFQANGQEVRIDNSENHGFVKFSCDANSITAEEKEDSGATGSMKIVAVSASEIQISGTGIYQMSAVGTLKKDRD